VDGEKSNTIAGGGSSIALWTKQDGKPQAWPAVPPSGKGGTG